MRIVITTQMRDGMAVARTAIARIVRDTPAGIHGETLELLMMDVLMASRGPVRDTAEAAAVTLAAIALARLVEHERGEREVVA